ncbi:MAG: hypothetical protein V7K32_08185 [Nostoc sp.]|uniref:hypothetical protein n=1 Tax=Nostoc sp. TaxID=1180 RepID=UPI002FF84FC1
MPTPQDWIIYFLEVPYLKEALRTSKVRQLLPHQILCYKRSWDKTWSSRLETPNFDIKYLAIAQQGCRRHRY